jgi:hypothetical protein
VSFPQATGVLKPQFFNAAFDSPRNLIVARLVLPYTESYLSRLQSHLSLTSSLDVSQPEILIYFLSITVFLSHIICSNICSLLRSFSKFVGPTHLSRQLSQHMTMAKPPGGLPEIDKTPSRDGPLKQIELLPRNRYFFARIETLQRMHHTLSGGKLPFVILSGMGGVGKTQIALEYCYRHASDYDVILWLHAENRLSLERSMRDAASRLGILAEYDSALSLKEVQAALFGRASMSNLRLRCYRLSCSFFLAYCLRQLRSPNSGLPQYVLAARYSHYHNNKISA